MNGTDIMITAVEGGINYWAEILESAQYPRRIVVRDLYDDSVYTITAGDLSRATPKVRALYPKSIVARDICADDIDATAADVIFQIAAMGSIVYG